VKRSVDDFILATAFGAELIQGAFHPDPQNGTGAFACAKRAMCQIAGYSACLPLPIGAQEQIGRFPSADMPHESIRPSH